MHSFAAASSDSFYLVRISNAARSIDLVAAFRRMRVMRYIAIDPTFADAYNKYTPTSGVSL